MFPEAKPSEGNIEVEAVFCYTSHMNSDLEKTGKKSFCLRRLGHKFQGARPDHVRVESSCFCFPRELVSFDRRDT